MGTLADGGKLTRSVLRNNFKLESRTFRGTVRVDGYLYVNGVAVTGGGGSVDVSGLATKGEVAAVNDRVDALPIEEMQARIEENENGIKLNRFGFATRSQFYAVSAEVDELEDRLDNLQATFGAPEMQAAIAETKADNDAIREEIAALPIEEIQAAIDNEPLFAGYASNWQILPSKTIGEFTGHTTAASKTVADYSTTSTREMLRLILEPKRPPEVGAEISGRSITPADSTTEYEIGSNIPALSNVSVTITFGTWLNAYDTNGTLLSGAAHTATGSSFGSVSANGSSSTATNTSTSSTTTVSWNAITSTTMGVYTRTIGPVTQGNFLGVTNTPSAADFGTAYGEYGTPANFSTGAHYTRTVTFTYKVYVPLYKQNKVDANGQDLALADATVVAEKYDRTPSGWVGDYASQKFDIPFNQGTDQFWIPELPGQIGYPTFRFLSPPTWYNWTEGTHYSLDTVTQRNGINYKRFRGRATSGVNGDKLEITYTKS